VTIRKTSLGTEVPLLALMFSFALLTASCSESRFVDHAIIDVERRLEISTPPARIDRDEKRIEAEWSLEDSRTPTAYLTWAEQQLRGDYELTQRTEGVISFAKETEGDALYLRLSVDPTVSGANVTITLEAMPD
jgi:hypothetical protein